MALKLPKIIGHRGACGYAPENTLESIKTAAELGIKWVELDVKLTKDDVAIIFHDDELDRTTNGSGLVMNTTYEDIKQLEAGSWFADSFAGIKIPTLEETLELLIDLDMSLNLEIKPCAGREVQTAEAALDILSRYWDETDKLLISSFSHVSLETAMEMAPEWHRGLLLDDEWPENWGELAEYLEVASININGNKVEREQIEAIIDLGKPILAYTINDPQRFRTLQSWGVDGVFTDVPDVIKDAILTVH
jgi:glycerophosphoryl diester phosphodiesterase